MHGQPPKATRAPVCTVFYALLGGPRQSVKKINNKKSFYSISLHFPLFFDSSASPQAVVCFLLEHGPRWASWLLYHFIYLPLFYILSFSLSLSPHYHLFHYRHFYICGLQRASGSLNYFWPCWASHRIRRGACEIDVSKHPACCLLHPTFPSDKERPPTGIPACSGPPKRPAV